MKHLFNQTLLNYWHFALLAALISFAFYQKTIIEPVQARFYAEKQVVGTIAVSQPAYHHAAYRDWSKVVYDTAVVLKNATLIQHNKFSAWYKIQFDTLPKKSALNFFQYETVVGFDETGHELTCKTAETGSGSNQHKRHLVFYLPDAPQYKTFYFKVFARKWQGNDVLSLELQDQIQLNNEIHRDFYENQGIAFWFMFVFGVGLFQIIYIGSLAWSRRKTEYLYYLAFSAVGIFYIFIARRFELGYLGEWRYVLTSTILAYFALIAFFYARFVRYYLNIKALDRAIEQQFRQGEWFLLIGTIINLLIYLVTYDLDYTFHFFIPLSACVILVSAYLLLLIFRLKTPFAKYLIMGVAFMVFTTVFRLIYAYLEQIGVITQALEIDAFGGVLGGVLDAICLNLGLNYKHRLENLEKQRALETIRNSIASDLHDDLGSGLSTIRVMSEMAQTGIKEPEKQRQIQRIAQQANDLIERMATIIWAMNTRNDTFESLTNYLHDFGIDFFDNIGINSHYSIEEMDPSVTQQIIVGETRRQIFLTFKEILNNIVKHAAATTVTIIITLTKNGFEIRIIDNGNGFDDADTEGSLEPIKPKPSPRNGNGGNGLRNMKERMAAIGGTFQIFSEKNKGTTVILQIPINQS